MTDTKINTNATQTKKSADTVKLSQAALIAALSYVGYAFLKLPIGSTGTAIHFGNVFVVLGGLLLGPYWGGLAGAVGLTISDITSGYITSAPKTFILKLLIGIIAGLVAHKGFNISTVNETAKQTKIAFFAALASLGFNIFSDPIFGYFYKMYILGISQDSAAILAKISSAATLINSVVGIVCVTIIWTALYNPLKKAALLRWDK